MRSESTATGSPSGRPAGSARTRLTTLGWPATSGILSCQGGGPETVAEKSAAPGAWRATFQVRPGRVVAFGPGTSVISNWQGEWGTISIEDFSVTPSGTPLTGTTPLIATTRLVFCTSAYSRPARRRGEFASKASAHGRPTRMAAGVGIFVLASLITYSRR